MRNLLAVAVLLMGASLLTSSLEAASPTVITGLRVVEHLEVPSGTTLPATCNTGDQFQLITDGRVYRGLSNEGGGCTWIYIEPTLNPDPANRELAGHNLYSGGGDFTGLMTFQAQEASVDYLFLGNSPHWLAAFRSPQWIDVPLRTARVRVSSIRLLTGARDWVFAICESKALTSTCRRGVLKGSSRGWSLGYGEAEAVWTYLDRDGDSIPQMHIRVEPLNQDWMSMRVLLEGEYF